VKVGRAAIDEDAIRALEDAYPDIAFDWTRILEARPPDPEPAPEDRRRSRPRPLRAEPRRDDRPSPPSPSEPPRPAEPAPPVTPAAPLASSWPTVDGVPEGEQAEPTDTPPLEVSLQALDPMPDLDGEDVAPVPPARASEPSAAARILGSEGLLRLRARYAEVCARISAQVADPARQEALRALAERLNPDAWVTDADVQAGLEQFEQVLDQIRREVGPVRRRTRRGGRRNRKRREVPAGDPNTPAATFEPEDDPTQPEDAEPDDEV